jgi:hypothetical protein
MLSHGRTTTLGTEAAVAFYAVAKRHLSETPFKAEIRWQAECNLDEFSERDLLRETAWVILCSGFRESVIRNYFSFISLCFCDWESAAVICRNADLCRATALSVFKNTRKMEAIIDAAAYVNATGFETYRRAILQDPIVALRRLPYIGAITGYHLAKNLGADVAKPDRHLVRLAESQGFCDVHSFCSAIAGATGDPLRVVDVILWRFIVQENQSRGLPD